MDLYLDYKLLYDGACHRSIGMQIAGLLVASTVGDQMHFPENPSVSMLERILQLCHKEPAGTWIVVVVPSCSVHSEPPTGLCIWSHRSSVLSDGRRVSWVTVDDTTLDTGMSDVAVLFYGWGEDVVSDSKLMATWSKKATRVLSL